MSEPITQDEAQKVFAAMAAKGDEIAFHILAEGCECRAQLMIENILTMGISPGRAWGVKTVPRRNLASFWERPTIFHRNRRMTPALPTFAATSSAWAARFFGCSRENCRFQASR